jgi:hypothetical protein
MAQNLLATVLNDYVASYPSNLDAAENRAANLGLLALAQADTPNLIDAVVLAANKNSERQPTKIPVLKDLVLSVTSARSLTIATTQSESAFVTLSYATIATGFSINEATYGDNYIGMQADLNRKMMAVEKAFGLNIDGLIYTKLNTDKAQYNAANGNPYTLNVTNDLEIPFAERENFMNEIDGIFEANELSSGIINIVGSPRVNSLVRKINQSAVYNKENLALSIGNKNFRFSNQVTNVSPIAYTMFCMAPGSIGLLNWNNPDARMGLVAMNGESEVVAMPGLGMNIAVFRQRNYEDLSGTYAGANHTVVTRYEFSTDICLVTPYNSKPTTKATPIFKAVIPAE